MANSYVTFLDYTGSGQTEYTIPFNFLNPEHIKVSSANINGLSNPLIWNYIPILTWNNNLVDGETSYPFGTYSVVFENGVNKIKYAKISANQSLNVTIYRRTPALNTTYFSNGSPIQASDLNSILLQNSYSIEETIEAVDSISLFKVISELNNKVAKTGDNLTGGLSGVTSLALTDTGQGIFAPQVQLQGGTIRNVPTPAYNTDAVNKAYVDGLTLSGGSQPVIANDSITSELLRKVVGEEAVTSTAIRTSAVTSTKLNANAVTADKIFQGSVTNIKIGTGAVTSSKIAQNAVTSTAINNGAIIEDKIGTGAVTNTKLGTGSVTNDKILSGTITSDKLANQTLSGDAFLANNSISASKLNNSGLNWGINSFNLDKTYVYTTAELIDAPSATINANNVVKKETLSYLTSEAINSGLLPMLSGSFKPNSSITINSQTLNQFQGAIPTFELDTTPDSNGYYPYNIYIKNPYLLGKFGGITIFKWQDRYAGSYPEYGSGGLGNVQPTFFYKTISNIPFNYIIENENPEISLTGTPYTPLTTSGNIVFNNLGQTSKKYLIKLIGTAECDTSTGILYLKPISDSYYPYNNGIYVPKSVARIAFNSSSYKIFNITTILNIPSNDSVTFPVQYYYTDNLNTAPTANNVRGFGRGADYLVSNSGYSAPPVAWRSSAYDRWNESIVDLIIQRIK